VNSEKLKDDEQGITDSRKKDNGEGRLEKKIENFKDLKIWQKGIDLAKTIYKVTESFPAKEIYGIVGQMRRSVMSVPSNIAEGFMRKHNKEYRQFLYIALGSIAELETQVIISEQLGFLNNKESKTIQISIDEINKMTMGLIKCL
jgi:four helix bundle protein